jgi:hypothetical protein
LDIGKVWDFVIVYNKIKINNMPDLTLKDINRVIAECGNEPIFAILPNNNMMLVYRVEDTPEQNRERYEKYKERVAIHRMNNIIGEIPTVCNK